MHPPTHRMDTISGVAAGGGGRGKNTPDTSHREISGDLPGKEKQGKKRGNGEEKKENRKREDGKLKMEGGKVRK